MAWSQAKHRQEHHQSLSWTHICNRDKAPVAKTIQVPIFGWLYKPENALTTVPPHAQHTFTTHTHLHTSTWNAQKFNINCVVTITRKKIDIYLQIHLT